MNWWLKQGEEIASIVALAVFLVLIGLNFTALVLAAPSVFAHLWYAQYYFLIITPWPIGLFPLVGPSLVAWFAVIVFAISASVIYYYTTNFWAIVKESRVPIAGKRTAELYFMTLFVTLVVYYIVGLLSPAPPKTPDFQEYPEWAQYMALAYASFHEELITRVFLLGLPLFAVHGIMQIAGRGEMRPLYRYVVGGGFEIGRFEVLFILFSASMFGVAHMLGGWDWVKVLPTLVFGIAAGYLFLRMGLYASIMLHFGTNYLSFAIALLMKGGLFGALFMVVLVAFMLALGLYATLKYAYLVWKEIADHLSAEGATRRGVISPLSGPDPLGPYWHRLRCRQCGGTTYEYLGGRRIRCVNCGRVIDVPEELWYRGRSRPPRT